MFFTFLSPSYFIQHCVFASSGVMAPFGAGEAGAVAGCAAGVRSALLLPCAQAASRAAIKKAAITLLCVCRGLVWGHLRIGRFISLPDPRRHRSIVRDRATETPA